MSSLDFPDSHWSRDMWEFAEHIGPSPIAWFACVESGFQSYFGTIFKLFFTLTASLYSLALRTFLGLAMDFAWREK